MTGGTDFPDVASTAYYADATRWASANGIVSGYPNGNFGPNDSITRQQFAAILWRYAGSPAASRGQILPMKARFPLMLPLPWTGP